MMGHQGLYGGMALKKPYMGPSAAMPFGPYGAMGGGGPYGMAGMGGMGAMAGMGGAYGMGAGMGGMGSMGGMGMMVGGLGWGLGWGRPVHVRGAAVSACIPLWARVGRSGWKWAHLHKFSLDVCPWIASTHTHTHTH